MGNCAVPEMNELLPELAADRLTGAALARVSAHVAACDACAAEVELLRAARRALSRGVPTVDVSRVVATTRTRTRPVAVVRAVPSQPARATYHRTSWTAWRIAAVATLAVGGLSLAVLRGPFGAGGRVGRSAEPTTTHAAAAPMHPAGAAPRAPVGAPVVANPTPAPTPVPQPTEVASAAQTPDEGSARDGLSVAGDMSELSDGDIETLLQGMDGVEAEPSSEPEESAPAIAAVAP
jgi:hypothetical protein